MPGLLLLAALASTPARVAVLPIELPDGRTDARRTFEAIQRAAVLRPGIDLIPEEEMFALAAGLVGPVVACGSDKDCLVAELQRIDARYGLVVIVNRIADPPLLHLSLIDTAAGEIAAERSGTVRGEKVAAETEAMAVALFEAAGFEQRARLDLSVRPPDAELFLDGDLVSSGPQVVAPGRHRVGARRTDYRSVERRVEIAAGQQRHVELELERASSIWSSPWLWVGVGAAVVAASVTSAVLLTSPAECLCITRTGEPCPDRC